MKSKQGAYDSFLATYKECVVKVVETGYAETFEGSEALTSEMRALWTNIKQQCVNIMVISINLLYSNSDQIVQTLYTQMVKVSNPNAGENCSIYLNYLSVAENSKKLLE